MRKIYRLLAVFLCIINLLGCNSDADEKMEYAVLIGEDASIINSIMNVDLLVIDAEYFTADDIRKLRENGVKEIYSYLNIGSIENFRTYYSDYCQYILGEYDNWPEEGWIDVSEIQWQEFVTQRVDELSQKNIDGFFVDNTDVYYFYPEKEIYDGIITILQNIKRYNKKVIINGGDFFVKKYFASEKNEIIDGINQECVYTTYDFEKKIYKENSEENKEYFSNYLDLAIENGCKAYALEYADNPAIHKKAREYAQKHDYICYVSGNIELVTE